MHKKFSQRVERVVGQARNLARDGDREYLGTEHVLLAILNEGTGVGAKILNELGVDSHRLGAEIDRLVKKSLEETLVFGNLPGSPHLKSTVAAAINLAEQFQAEEVCTEHLVLAMLKEEGSVAERALNHFHVTFDAARSKIDDLNPTD